MDSPYISQSIDANLFVDSLCNISANSLIAQSDCVLYLCALGKCLVGCFPRLLCLRVRRLKLDLAAATITFGFDTWMNTKAATNGVFHLHVRNALFPHTSVAHLRMLSIHKACQCTIVQLHDCVTTEHLFCVCKIKHAEALLTSKGMPDGTQEAAQSRNCRALIGLQKMQSKSGISHRVLGPVPCCVWFVRHQRLAWCS